MGQKEKQIISKEAEVKQANTKLEEMQQYLERKEEEVVRLRGSLKEVKEQNEHLLKSQEIMDQREENERMSDDVKRQIEEI